MTLSTPVWLFDLDNTLHDASHAIFPALNANMNTYIANVLGDGGVPADIDLVNATRIAYWKRYGATLLGMMLHHGVRADDFLHQTHMLDDIEAMMRFERGLGQLLRRLPGRKILLTNAPRRYARDVLRRLGLQRHFSHHISIESMQVHRQLRPKPSKLMLRKLMRHQRLQAQRCILVEDTLANLRSAKAIGMGTVWITQYLRGAEPSGAPKRNMQRPAYVDLKVKSVRNLPSGLHRLGRQAGTGFPVKLQDDR
jgi:putative hydrolase of the HAD superfamily